jgi:hypothetical protein
MQVARSLIVCSVLVFAGLAAHAQSLAVSHSDADNAAVSLTADASALPDEPQAQQPSPPSPSPAPADQGAPPSKQQPKRILGLMPNYRAVSAGAIPPPPGPRLSFKIATQNSFDYSSFIFVGVTSLLAESSNAHRSLGKGVGGYWGYYWRGFVDKTDGNYLVIFALPSILHQDERYFAKGEGPIFKRGVYAASRVLIARDYHGHDTFNESELLGRGIAQAVSISYYPSQDRTVDDVMEKYGYALGRDALTSVFREFWPDIAVHVLHRHP